jgi:hypothetical protein
VSLNFAHSKARCRACEIRGFAGFLAAYARGCSEALSGRAWFPRRRWKIPRRFGILDISEVPRHFEPAGIVLRSACYQSAGGCRRRGFGGLPPLSARRASDLERGAAGTSDVLWLLREPQMDCDQPGQGTEDRAESQAERSGAVHASGGEPDSRGVYPNWRWRRKR